MACGCKKRKNVAAQSNVQAPAPKTNTTVVVKKPTTDKK